MGYYSLSYVIMNMICSKDKSLSRSFKTHINVHSEVEIPCSILNISTHQLLKAIYIGVLTDIGHIHVNFNYFVVVAQQVSAPPVITRSRSVNSTCTTVTQIKFIHAI